MFELKGKYYFINNVNEVLQMQSQKNGKDYLIMNIKNGDKIFIEISGDQEFMQLINHIKNQLQ